MQMHIGMRTAMPPTHSTFLRASPLDASDRGMCFPASRPRGSMQNTRGILFLPFQEISLHRRVLVHGHMEEA